MLIVKALPSAGFFRQKITAQERIALLLQCAKNFARLFAYTYRFLVARKGVQREFEVTFQKTDFHHLAGLHKLTDLRQFLNGTRDSIFDKILAGDITQKMIETSEAYTEIADRLEALSHLEEMLDSDNTIFKFNEHVRAFSRIQSDYLLEGTVRKRRAFLFLSRRNPHDERQQVCRSFFPKGKNDYAAGQPKYALLRREKIRVADGSVAARYER